MRWIVSVTVDELYLSYQSLSSVVRGTSRLFTGIPVFFCHGHLKARYGHSCLLAVLSSVFRGTLRLFMGSPVYCCQGHVKALYGYSCLLLSEVPRDLLQAFLSSVVRGTSMFDIGILVFCCQAYLKAYFKAVFPCFWYLLTLICMQSYSTITACYFSLELEYKFKY